MNERTKLIKKAVLTGVGASSNPDRIKAALRDAIDDIFKVGHDLLDDLEGKGKDKAENAQSFLKTLQEQATRRTGEISGKMHTSMKKAAKELGLITREDFEEIKERLNNLEELLGGCDEEGKKSRKSKRSSHD